MFGLSKKIDAYYPGKIITAADLNAILARLEKLENIGCDPQVQIMDGPGGLHLSLAKYIVPIRRFQLYGNLIVGGTAEAKIVFRDVNNVLQSTANPEFEVIDTFGEHFGIAGDYGWCFTLSDSTKRWEILSIHHIARTIKFELLQHLSRHIEYAEAIVRRWSDGYKPPTNVNVYNLEWASGGIFEFVAPATAVGLAIFNDVLRIYEIWQIQCDADGPSSSSSGM